MVKLLTAVILSVLMFTPAPEVLPGDPFIFDANQCLSSPMLAILIPVGGIHNGQLDVYEPDGELVTVLADKITVDEAPVTIKDIDDPLGHFSVLFLATIICIERG